MIHECAKKCITITVIWQRVVERQCMPKHSTNGKAKAHGAIEMIYTAACSMLDHS